MENPLTYAQVTERCKDIALDLTPVLPTNGTLESWQAFETELDNVESDLYALASEAVENTDWAIYTHFGWKILHVMPQSAIDDAESQFIEYNGSLTLEESCGGTFDIWSLQSSIAFFLLLNLVQDKLREALKELRELADQAIYNIEEAMGYD